MILVIRLLVISMRSDICCRLFMLRLKYWPKYLNDLPLLTEGTKTLFMMSFGRNCVEEVEAFFIPKVEHLSTLITIPAHVHHREK